MKEIIKLQKNIDKFQEIILNQLIYIDKIEIEKEKYKKAYHEINCYFDSISDEEKPKLAKRLKKIFK
jgi:hypothetical protein